MITEEEKLDMGTAYYEDGFIDGVEKGRRKERQRAKPKRGGRWQWRS